MVFEEVEVCQIMTFELLADLRTSKPVAIVGLLYALGLVVTQTFPGSTPVKASKSYFSLLST